MYYEEDEVFHYHIMHRKGNLFVYFIYKRYNELISLKSINNKIYYVLTTTVMTVQTILKSDSTKYKLL